MYGDTFYINNKMMPRLEDLIWNVDFFEELRQGSHMIR